MQTASMQDRCPYDSPSYYTTKVTVPIKKVWPGNEEAPRPSVSLIIEDVASSIVSPARIDSEIQNVPLIPLVFTTNSDVFRSTLSAKYVVLKLRRRTIHEPSADDLFFKELKIWVTLKHKNILSLLGVYACFPELRQVALVSEYQRKGTLVPYVHTHPDVDRIRLLLDVAQGLRYLHSQENPIIHGDIRGANVVIGGGGIAMIFDFGCACTEEEARETKEFDGTLRWMAPEKIDPSRAVAVTQKADIYCFGCLCIEIFTGEKPFPHIANDCTVMFKILQNEPPILSRPSGQHALQLTDTLWETIQTCCKSEPSRRPFSSDICSSLTSMSIGESRV
ncbi:kinase-like domain-containing protein [Cyathus striatus]|nr:kinase-like domain-containing protein [Cyathus striatus]